MSSRRPIAIALAASAFYAGVFVTAAQAEMHYVRVTLVTGQELTITVEVPPGTPVDQLQIPGLPAAVASIVDLGSTETTPTPTAPRPRRSRPRRRARRPRRPTPSNQAGGKTKGNKDKDKGKTKSDPPRTKGEDQAEESPTQARHQHRVADGQGREGHAGADRGARGRRRTDQQADAPASTNPSFSLSEPGAAKIGVPNFFIDKFRIPPFLLPIYQAAGTQYGIRWELLAAINEIETNYGRNLNVSSAGAQGWMQFMPASWEAYGVDGNSDGLMDPYNPVDAIFAAARYLKAAGADTDIRKARLRLQPRRLVRGLGAAARAGHRRPAVQPRRVAHRPDRGPLPGRGEGPLHRSGLAALAEGDRLQPRGPARRRQPPRPRDLRRRRLARGRGLRRRR